MDQTLYNFCFLPLSGGTGYKPPTFFFWGGDVCFFYSPRLHSLSDAAFAMCFPEFKHSIFSNLHIRLLDWALPRGQLTTCCRFPLIKHKKWVIEGHRHGPGITGVTFGCIGTLPTIQNWCQVTQLKSARTQCAPCIVYIHVCIVRRC